MALHREGHGTLEDVRLYELSVLCPFQREDVSPSGIHHHQFHVLPGVEVAVAHDELVVAGVQVLAPRDIFLAPIRFIAVQTLVCVTERHIQQRLLFLIPGQSERLECHAVGSDVLQITDVTRPACHQRAFTQVHLRCAVVGTRRKVGGFLLRLFRFHSGEKGGRGRFRCESGRSGGGFRLRFGLPCFLLRCGFHVRDILPFLLMLRRQFPKLLAPFRCQVHHHFVKAVDGRVGFPIQSGINIIRIAFGFNIFRL